MDVPQYFFNLLNFFFDCLKLLLEFIFDLNYQRISASTKLNLSIRFPANVISGDKPDIFVYFLPFRPDWYKVQSMAIIINTYSHGALIRGLSN